MTMIIYIIIEFYEMIFMPPFCGTYDKIMKNGH